MLLLPAVITPNAPQMTDFERVVCDFVWRHCDKADVEISFTVGTFHYKEEELTDQMKALWEERKKQSAQAVQTPKFYYTVKTETLTRSFLHDRKPPSFKVPYEFHSALDPRDFTRMHKNAESARAHHNAQPPAVDRVRCEEALRREVPVPCTHEERLAGVSRTVERGEAPAPARVTRSQLEVLDHFFPAPLRYHMRLEAAVVTRAPAADGEMERLEAAPNAETRVQQCARFFFSAFTLEVEKPLGSTSVQHPGTVRVLLPVQKGVLLDAKKKNNVAKFTRLVVQYLNSARTVCRMAAGRHRPYAPCGSAK
eukprot:gnl/Chilomastix_cuspidata/3593.p2 GENE.gnl/Chilomastix_cuspidata/3593~~gnl/Chilomastix_cuspidata/3593.p2  ORF type:complete len:310 (+),score=103.14 gnl/Chilomastix_cuspidata/3593:304-1233(+)